MTATFDRVEAERRYRKICSGWDDCITLQQHQAAVEEYKELHLLLFPSSCQYVPGWLTPEQREIKKQAELAKKLRRLELKEEFKSFVDSALSKSLTNISDRAIDDLPWTFMSRLNDLVNPGKIGISNIFAGQNNIRVQSKEKFELHVRRALDETLHWCMLPEKVDDFMKTFSEKLSFKVNYS
ncbi:hypothetical protein QJ850_gp879 [Acanthamoeba polyphaga mimivirus]|uniref:Uncharacterized protein n=1 Tax=Acanthamoeba polyphaga mimivirus Kroon TaxID=3069720 RepID=A0A0G2Y255_9VIRU|nr:hypothetical protein QJ850_gp879 [Acanthamoeba polyphaga mimivirus]AKI79820.1 hypothetical protein [Acanthamoeba polyphaga mimivirus Kroon]